MQIKRVRSAAAAVLLPAPLAATMASRNGSATAAPIAPDDFWFPIMDAVRILGEKDLGYAVELAHGYGVEVPLATIGIAEKGYISLRVTAKATGGHSSMPSSRTAVGALAKAIVALEASPFPSGLDGPTRGMLEALAPYTPFSKKLVLGNLGITGSLVQRMLSSSPMGAALLHTTIAPTPASRNIDCHPATGISQTPSTFDSNVATGLHNDSAAIVRPRK